MVEQKKITLCYPWDKNGYCPYAEFVPELNKEGVKMHIEVQEENPRREKTEHFEPVHLDSCVEWFVNFAPDRTNRYFNFEVNANGKMNVAFRKDRYDTIPMTKEDVELLGIAVKIEAKKWTVDYTVPFSLIRKYIPEFQENGPLHLKTNFYKCGDETEFPHYGVWKIVKTDEPDFHRPEYFGNLTLE